MDETLTFYGLKEAPFSLSPDPRFLFISEQHRACLAKTQYIVQHRQGLSIVFGDIGTGKTTVAKRIFDLFRENSQIAVAFMTNPQYPSAMQLLKAVATEFDLPHKRSRIEQMEELQAFLIDKFQKKINVVLIVDEAQLLVGPQFELIRQLLNFETNSQKLIQIILFGQLELRAKLRLKRALASRVATYATLDPFDFDAAADMIRFRLTIAGTKHPDLFTSEAMQHLFALSRGIPREMVRLSLHALYLGAVNESPVINPDIIEEAQRHILKSTTDAN